MTLIWLNQESSKEIQLHHLGKISLEVKVINPEPKEPIPNWQEDVDIGPTYIDEYLYPVIEHDFYLVYKKKQLKTIQTETVSFAEVDEIFGEVDDVFFNKGKSARNKALIRGLVPSQHPTVMLWEHDELEESALDSFNVTSYKRIYFKRQRKNNEPEWKVNNFSFYVDEATPWQKDCINDLYVPGDIEKHFYEQIPLNILDVLGLLKVLYKKYPDPCGYSTILKQRFSERELKTYLSKDLELRL